MKLKFSLLKENFFPLLLILITLIICISNYKLGTYLSGWDTLHPEFNFPDYFKRIFSVWQEHQGLGAVAAQAHAAELPRVILMLFFSLFLPLSFLRYFYFFLTLIIGPLGVYFFTRNLVKDNLVSFSCALLYLLNLTTVQQYSVPLEMFATLYAFIGWIFLFGKKFLDQTRKKDLWAFVLVIILSAPMAHTPTLFYIFFACFFIYISLYGFFVRKKRPAGLLILIILLLNSYWILPNIYFIKQYGASVANSKIHSQFSDRAFQVGKNFGDLPDTAIMKNFLFDWGEYNNTDGSFIHLMQVWSKHFSKPIIKVIGNSVFILIAVGFFASLYKRGKNTLSILPVFLISYFFIANDNSIFENLSNFLGPYFSVLKEALRFPFTKFSILLLFCYCIYFAHALSLISDFSKKLLKRRGPYVVLIIICLSLLIYMQPIFSGLLINSKMRVNIPNYYFEVFNYFQKLPQDARTAVFPVHTFWGWSYYNWGYEGAGFTWFGISQPLLNREFDRWHPANEGFYWEISYAVYHEEIKLLESVLNKYQVKYLMLDFSITDASSAKSAYMSQFKKLLAQSKLIKEDKAFGSIELYKVENSDSVNFLAAGNLPKIGPKFQWTDIDTAFRDNGPYITDEKPDVFYPFRSLFTNHTSSKMDFELQETDSSYIFKKDIPEKIKDYRLNIPDNNSEIVWFDGKNLDSSGSFLPKVYFNNQTLLVEIPKINGYFSKEIDPTKEINWSTAKNCDFLRLSMGEKNEIVKNQIVNKDGNILRLISKLANNCSASFAVNNLSHNLSYLISFTAKNIENKTLLFWLENNNFKKSDIEVYLLQEKNLTKFYFIQPPLDQFGTGYTLHFDNWSFNKNFSVNDLGKISIYPIPYYFLTNLSLVKNYPEKGKLDNIPSSHPLPYLYIANTGIGQKDLVLYQSYDPGWQAFYFKDLFHIQRISRHILINNWANGWEINSPGKIVIIFLPQFLEFLGFGIFIGILYYLWRIRGSS